MGVNHHNITFKGLLYVLLNIHNTGFTVEGNQQMDEFPLQLCMLNVCVNFMCFSTGCQTYFPSVGKYIYNISEQIKIWKIPINDQCVLTAEEALWPIIDLTLSKVAHVKDGAALSLTSMEKYVAMFDFFTTFCSFIISDPGEHQTQISPLTRYQMPDARIIWGT